MLRKSPFSSAFFRCVRASVRNGSTEGMASPPSGKSPADVRQESDGVCSDPARDVSIAGSSAIALGNHRVCCPARRRSCLVVGRRGFRKDLGATNHNMNARHPVERGFASFPPSRIPQVGRDPRSGTLSERKKTQVVFGAQTSITL